jgi:hypothetical protein
MRLGKLQSLLAALREKDRVVGLKQVAEHLAVGGRVVDDQDLL